MARIRRVDCSGPGIRRRRRGRSFSYEDPAGALRGSPDELRTRLAAVAADEGRDDADRDAARSFLPFLGGDDPGAATDVPRSRVEQGPPPTYDLSDERNTP